jgi:hypothetical protein
MADPHPGCKNHCRKYYETRLLTPNQTANNIEDGFKKCLTCMIWIKVPKGRRGQACPCCHDRMRTMIKSRSRAKHLEQVVRI